MIGPFSTTLVPLSSSSSVDRQVLINVEASAISPDERTFGFIFTKIPVTRRSKKKKKKKDQGAWTRSPVLSVCLRPPNIFLAPAAAAVQWCFRTRRGAIIKNKLNSTPIPLECICKVWSISMCQDWLGKRLEMSWALLWRSPWEPAWRKSTNTSESEAWCEQLEPPSPNMMRSWRANQILYTEDQMTCAFMTGHKHQSHYDLYCWDLDFSFLKSHELNLKNR